MNKLYRFYWDKGRNGYVESLFIATDLEVQSSIGKTVYFGEILGKHSEVCGVIQEYDFTLLSDDQDLIGKLIDIFGYTISGYNPLEYIEIDEADEAEVLSPIED